MDNEGKSLRVAVKAHDTLREGLSTAVEDVSLTEHPVQQIQQSKQRLEKEFRTAALSAQFGLAAAMKFNADEHLLQNVHRFPGLKSSRLGMDILKGKDTTIGVEDWMESDLDKRYFANFHATMERHLKL